MVLAYSCYLTVAVIAFLVPFTHQHLVDVVINKFTRKKVEAVAEAERCYMASEENRRTSQSPLRLLMTQIADKELRECVPSVLFDPSLPTADIRDDIYDILSAFPVPTMIGQLHEPTAPSWMPKPPVHRNFRKHPGWWQEVVGPHDWKCRSYVVILDDIVKASDIVGNASKDRVILVTRSPLWRIRDFLSGPLARRTLNLLVVQDRNWKSGDPKNGFVDINLMTHRVFGDSLGGSFPQILTSWRCDHFTRPWVRLFPPKMLEGFFGHQFKVATVDSPPYVYKMTTEDLESSWDGYEVRIMRLLAGVLNFTLDFREPLLDAEDRSNILASSRVVREVLAGSAEVGAGGVYITTDRLALLDIPQQHTQDCAAFMTLASVALPRYRAILGPFQWTVWLAVSMAYFLAIVPLVFSHHLSLGILIRHPSEIENMFWYVFGTFTNLFQFKGQDTWVGSKRDSTRMIVGWYWAFSIIITACYTGSVISFIAFPVFPALVESMKDVLHGGYRVGTLNSGGWTTWFSNSSDPQTNKLLKNADLVSSVWEGIQNMTHASFFRPYSFLGPRLYLEHVVRTNYSAENKRSLVHIGEECFVPFWVSLIFPRDAVYSERFSHVVLRALQSGLIDREKRNVRWDIQRASTGALLQVSSASSLRITSAEERTLTLDDTQGMFLLLGAGVLIAALAMTVENVFGRVSALRDRYPPGPRRRSSVGMNSLWEASSRRTSATYGFPETRPKPSFEGKHRRSVNSLPGNMMEQIDRIAKERSPSIATAPPIILVESTHSTDSLYRAASLESVVASEEEHTDTSKESYRGLRSLSIFSWVSAFAAKLKMGRGSQSRDPLVDIDSPTETRDQTSEPVSVGGDRQICTVDPDAGILDSNLEIHEPTSGDVESVFGCRQDVEIEDLDQNGTDETPRLAFLEIFEPLSSQGLGAEDIIDVSREQVTGNIEKEQPISNLETEQSTSDGEEGLIKEVSLSKPPEVSQESRAPCVSTSETSKVPPPNTQTEKELSTKLHRRTSSTVSRAQSTAEPHKKIRVPRNTSNRPK